MANEFERFQVPMVASALKVPQETVRSAANRSRLSRNADGWYLLPIDPDHPQRRRFVHLCAKGPQTRAEQLRRDLGCRPARR